MLSILFYVGDREVQSKPYVSPSVAIWIGLKTE